MDGANSMTIDTVDWKDWCSWPGCVHRIRRPFPTFPSPLTPCVIHPIMNGRKAPSVSVDSSLASLTKPIEVSRVDTDTRRLSAIHDRVDDAWRQEDRCRVPNGVNLPAMVRPRFTYLNVNNQVIYLTDLTTASPQHESPNFYSYA